MKKWVALAGVLLIIVCSISGADAKRRGQDPTWVLPIVTRDSLLNGLQLAVIERQGANSVSVRLRVNNGATFDLANKGGLADLTAGMLLKGGAGLDAKAIADTVESLGLTVSVRTGWDATDITINGPSDSLESIFDLLSRIITAPAFDQKELDSLKAARAESIKAEPETESELAKRRALEHLFGSHPFGRSARGTQESIARITRSDLLYFYGKFYLANNSFLLVTGDVTPERVTRLARSKLGSWKKGEKVPATFRPPETSAARRLVVIDRPSTEKAHACIAQIGASRRSPDLYQILVISELVSSRLSQLAAANAGSSAAFELDMRGLAGPMLIELSARPEIMVALIDSTLAVLSEIQAGKITPDQLESAKARAISRFADGLRTPEGTAGVLLDIELYGLGRDFPVNFSEKVNGVAVPDVTRAAQVHLKPGAAVISVAGPLSRLEPELKKLGAVAARY